MDNFDVSVAKWVEKAKGNMNEVFRGIALAALNRVKELTPVKTGYLKAGWQASVQRGALLVVKKAGDDGVAAISRAVAGDTIYIFNPVVYARRIEFGFNGKDSLGRTYHQKGHHMMAQTIAEIPGIAQKILSEVNDQ